MNRTGRDRGRRVAVLGLGGVLMGDDALGPYAIRVLEATCEFPPSVELRDLGTPGLDLVPYVEGLDALILIDTVRSSGAAGELRTYRRAEILQAPAAPRLGPHDSGLREALLAVELIDAAPREVLLVGVIPQETAQGIGLSPAVREALPRVVAEVRRELERLGLPAVERPDPRPPDIWWEQPAPGGGAAR